MRIASLSSGYGGLEMALASLAPLDVRWHAEIDPDASRVLKTYWPDVPNLGDFTMPGFWESAERAEVHLGGIPCQPFSAAGRQRGEDDHRHLWPFWREGIALHRPASVIFENVQGLTRGRMRPIFDGICRDLAGLGYEVRWLLLGACAVGAAHHRHRVFLLARLGGRPGVTQVPVQTCGQRNAAYVPTPVVTDARGARNSTAGRRGGKTANSGTTLTDFITMLPTPTAVSYGSNQGGAAGRVGPLTPGCGGPARLDLLPTTTVRDSESRGEGSAEYWEKHRAERGARTLGAGATLGAALNLLPTPRAADAARGAQSVEREQSSGRLNGVELVSAVQPERWGKYAEAIARHEAVLGRPAPEPTEIGPKGGRRLAAAFSEWLMMLPEGHLTSVLERNPALARAGNGVVPLQAATALRLLGLDSCSTSGVQ